MAALIVILSVRASAGWVVPGGASSVPLEVTCFVSAELLILLLTELLLILVSGILEMILRIRVISLCFLVVRGA